MKLTVRDRFRLFFRGHQLLRDMVTATTTIRELRRQRDGLNDLVEVILHTDEAVPGTVYILVDAAAFDRVLTRVYGPDHPHTVAQREIVARIRARYEAEDDELERKFN